MTLCPRVTLTRKGCNSPSDSELLIGNQLIRIPWDIQYCSKAQGRSRAGEVNRHAVDGDTEEWLKAIGTIVRAKKGRSSHFK